MPEYTYSDVIIDPDDPRVEVGAEYYFGDNAGQLLHGARTGWKAEVLRDVCKATDEYSPFDNGSSVFSCIIRKKEQKYVPFDLSKPEVRDKLRGKWIKEKGANNAEYCIDWFVLSHTQWTAIGMVANTLLGDYEFLDGTPCGEMVLE